MKEVSKDWEDFTFWQKAFGEHYRGAYWVIIKLIIVGVLYAISLDFLLIYCVLESLWFLFKIFVRVAESDSVQVY